MSQAHDELLDSGSDDGAGRGSFNIHLDNFEGPFDLLLQLISKHKMDITEVSLSKVTVEFIAHIKAAGEAWDLEQTSSFLVVAATLLDLKAARLLPSGEIDDAEDLALLEARDLLFARLLQYRAFKIVSSWIADVLVEQGRRYPRQVGMEQHFTQLMPEVTIGVSPERFAELAAKAMTPKQADVLSLAHLHAPAVNVRDEAVLVVDRLRRAGSMTFRSLTDDAGGQAHRRLPVPGAAGTLPGGGRGLRAAHAAGGVDRTLDRFGRGRPHHLRRVRRSAAAGRRRRRRREERPMRKPAIRSRRYGTATSRRYGTAGSRTRSTVRTPCGTTTMMTKIRKAIVTSPKTDATGPPADGEAIAALSSSQDRAQPGGTAADQTAERADEIVEPTEDPDTQPETEAEAVPTEDATGPGAGSEETDGDGQPTDEQPSDESR